MGGVRLEWDAKDAEIPRLLLPIQVVETVNASRADRGTLFETGADADESGWRNSARLRARWGRRRRNAADDRRFRRRARRRLAGSRHRLARPVIARPVIARPVIATVGSERHVTVLPDRVFRYAVRVGASGVVLAHSSHILSSNLGRCMNSSA
ncbi:MAG: hypothetical protein ACRDRK_27920 [Pseudonocardia sp.]